jgi:hypothetical protein
MRVRLPALLLSLGITSAAITTACNRPNPLYHGRDGQASDGIAPVGQAGQSGQGGQTGAAGDQGAGGPGGITGAAGGTDASAGAVGADGGADATLGKCTQAGECLTALGAPVCGAWECRTGQCAVVCPACTDKDTDGYGVGNGCAGPDCDDNNPLVGANSTRACYEGKGGTLGVGSCKAGAQVCTDGVWSTCSGQVLPSGEACNAQDDDCNGALDDGLGTVACGLGVCAQTAASCTAGVLGICQPGVPQSSVDDCDGKDNDCDGAIDEDCATGCIRVAPLGDDLTATGTVLRPFRTIQAAINYASAPVALRSKVLCVAGGLTCLDSTTYQTSDAGTFTMANGVSVYGNYEATTWARCPFGNNGFPNLTVTLQPRSLKGVIFPATVNTPTVLDGVRVVHFTSSSGPGAGGTAPTAAITIDGAKQAVVSNVVVADSQDTATSYGVNLLNGAEALITRSSIFGGIANTDAVAIRSVGSKPTIRDNCNTFDPNSGRCTGLCTFATLGLRGRISPNPGARGVAIDLVDSPGAIVERNSICGTQAAVGMGVHISGAAAGTIVRGNAIIAQGATTQAHGIWMDACGDASPWIVGNELIQADGTTNTTRIAAVGAAGACHPVIDGNVKITGGGEATQTSSTAVFCGAAGGVASRCTIVNNKLIQGSPSVHPAQATGVACDAGGCARIAGNKITGNGGGSVVGVALTGSGPLIERNDITGGCGTKVSMGILAEDSYARIENNIVRGASCGAGTVTPDVSGIHVHVAAGGNEVDVHSNTIDAGGGGACQGAAAGIGLGAAAGPKGRRGIFRDNILRAGGCNIARYCFWEDTAGTSPRLFERNDLDPTGAPTALYLTGANQAFTTLAPVSTLPGAAGNISADPMFVGPIDLHLGAASACVNAGTPAGAPKTDFDGKARDDKPDIGAFER